MLARLKRSGRMKAGRLLALLYLFCVVAPGAALAFGTSPGPCFDDPVVAAVRVHDDARQDHDAAHHHLAVEGHGDVSDFAGGGSHHHGKSGPGACCAILCLSAMPTVLPNVENPDPPVSTYASVTALLLHAEAPALLYRPPIA